MVCNDRRGICFDRYGPSIGLTEAFLGPAAAQTLTAILRNAPPDRRPGAEFSPAENVTCMRETGPCRRVEVVNEALTAVLYGPRRPVTPGGWMRFDLRQTGQPPAE